jgi:cation:H+ antiporter
MTIVAFCTSAPELVVSVGAALEGSSDISIGNVIGSNIFNILGVLGAAALIAPIVVDPHELKRDITVMIVSAVLVALVAQLGEFGRLAGAVFATGIVLYVWLSYRSELSNPRLPSAELHAHEAEEIETTVSLPFGAGLLGAGLAALVIGARLLILGATDIARDFGIPEAVIGLSLVAIGTSLPELATSAVAAARKHSDVAVGNVVGSNIFNALGILGVTALLRPVGVAEQIARVDVWVMLAISIALAPTLLVRGRIGRTLGAAFLLAYLLYAVFLFA